MNPRTTRLTFALLLGLVAASCFPPPKSNTNDGGNVNQPPPTPPPATEVKITRPADGDTVGQTEVVRGTSRGVPAGQKIWIAVFVHKVGRYYPQNMPADVQANGNWDSVTYFGIPADVGMKFDVLALTAAAAAQQAFDNYLTAARNKNSYPGLEQLPVGSTIQHRITVTRK